MTYEPTLAAQYAFASVSHPNLIDLYPTDLEITFKNGRVLPHNSNFLSSTTYYKTITYIQAGHFGKGLAEILIKNNLVMENTNSGTHMLEVLKGDMPEIKEAFLLVPQDANIYQITQQLATLTHILAHKHNFIAVKHCFQLAEGFLQEEDNQVKCAICQVYLYSLASLLNRRNEFSDVLYYLLTRELKQEYKKHFSNSPA